VPGTSNERRNNVPMLWNVEPTKVIPGLIELSEHQSRLVEFLYQTLAIVQMLLCDRGVKFTKDTLHLCM
jgi:hypothetical protein